MCLLMSWMVTFGIIKILIILKSMSMSSIMITLQLQMLLGRVYYTISAVYFKLGNLSLKYKSHSDFIQLVSLCIHRLVVKPYGIDSMLSPLINDIKILETNGIQINFDGNQHHFFGTLTYISADNLAAHALGKFHENFSTVLRFCRFCRATRYEVQGAINTKNFTLWDKETFNAQALDVENDNTTCLKELFQR